MMKSPRYTELPERAARAIDGAIPSPGMFTESVSRFGEVLPRAADADGATENFDGVTFTHHHVELPGDYDSINWHYVECGSGEPIVFLHGIPDSWYQWHHQMAALATTHRCIAVDLKGYGQSYTGPGDYRHEGAAEQLFSLLQNIDASTFNLVSHDRGTVQADFIVANHPKNVIRYGRGEQHLYHFNPVLAPQGNMLMNAPYNGMLAEPARFVVMAYQSLAIRPISDVHMRRLIQEFSYPGITHAVPRYYNANTFRQEWLARRARLLSAWSCPVLIMQGFDSKTQPREFYEHAADYIPNSSDVRVRYIPGGHYWSMESPVESTSALRHLLTM